MTSVTKSLGTSPLNGEVTDSTAEAIADALNALELDVQNPAQPGSSYLQVTNVRGAVSIQLPGACDWRAGVV